MHIAVTGGAGFIGSHLCERLVKDGHYVISLDNFSTGSKNNLSGVLENENFKSIECNIMDQKAIKNTLKEESIELLYHYAAIVGVMRTLENPKDVMDVNIRGTENVLEAALGTSCKKVVNISSSEVYGNPIEIPEKENSPKNVELPYAISKLTGEIYASIYQKKYGLKTTSLRLFNVYGPRQNSTPYGFVVGIFINNVLNNMPPVIYGDGFATRDFTYIEDNISATVLAAEKSAANGQVFNIAAGKPVTVLDLAETIIDLFGKKMKPEYQPEREHDIKHRFADISKMRTVLGYKPKYELREGLKLTIDWYKKNHRP